MGESLLKQMAPLEAVLEDAFNARAVCVHKGGWSMKRLQWHRQLKVEPDLGLRALALNLGFQGFTMPVLYVFTKAAGASRAYNGTHGSRSSLI